jgi:oligopeptide transport system permease protein
MRLPLANLPPSTQFWFGTDELGRDLFTRVCMGGRLSLFVGLVAAAIDIGIGVIFGTISALKAPKLMHIANILYALPYLVVVILFRLFLGSGLIPLILSLTIMGWITMARLIYGQMSRLTNYEFVMASRGFGATSTQLFWTHLLPHVKETILTTLLLTIPSAIFAEAFLSFMGLGVKPPLASWGTLASEGVEVLRYYPWRLLFPAFFISWTLFTFYGLEASVRRVRT